MGISDAPCRHLSIKYPQLSISEAPCRHLGIIYHQLSMENGYKRGTRYHVTRGHRGTIVTILLSIVATLLTFFYHFVTTLLPLCLLSCYRGIEAPVIMLPGDLLLACIERSGIGALRESRFLNSSIPNFGKF